MSKLNPCKVGYKRDNKNRKPQLKTSNLFESSLCSYKVKALNLLDCQLIIIILADDETRKKMKRKQISIRIYPIWCLKLNKEEKRKCIYKLTTEDFLKRKQKDGKNRDEINK